MLPFHYAALLLAILMHPVEWLSVFLSLSCLVHRMQGVDGYTQSGPKLVGTGASGSAGQGSSTAVSGDGLTACVGGFNDNSGLGAVWFYTRANAGTFAWMQQGSKIAPNDGVNIVGVYFGYCCSLSFNGNIAVVGGYYDNNQIGATWIITRGSSGLWTQQGAKHVGTGYVGTDIEQGISTSLASTSANVYVTGGYYDNLGAGIFPVDQSIMFFLCIILGATRSLLGVFPLGRGVVPSGQQTRGQWWE